MYRKGSFTQHDGSRDVPSLLRFITQGATGLPGFSVPPEPSPGESEPGMSSVSAPRGGEVNGSKGALMSADSLAAMYAQIKGESASPPPAASAPNPDSPVQEASQAAPPQGNASEISEEEKARRAAEATKRWEEVVPLRVVWFPSLA